MSHLQAYKNDLYELRFSPMCKPAAEVANLTQLESHTTRARMMMLWRIAEGLIEWTPREVALVYESTLDSISEAFDVFHYPVSQYMLAARADIWEAGLAPECVRQAVEASLTADFGAPDTSETLLLAGEIAQLGDDTLLEPMKASAQTCGIEASAWVVATGALAYTLGAWDVASAQAKQIIAGIQASGAEIVIADGPETAWALTKIYPGLGLSLPEGVSVKLLSVALDERYDNQTGPIPENGPVLFHDSRPACLLAEEMANHLAIMPGYLEDEAAFGVGAVFEAPRRLLDALPAQRVFGTWTRSLARTSGADDGLWMTYPHLAAGLAAQRLDYADNLGAETIITDSPLAASYLSKHTSGHSVGVKLLAEFFEGKKQ
ncbi:MAG: hypothetical protein U9R25_20675 [Chloroflexota bacterium]|nr:hypothetical protein [Chloroflexota bacterium]